jgi:hypothetical protein
MRRVGWGISLVMRSPLHSEVDFSGCGLVRRLCQILLHFLFGLKIDGAIFCAMVGVAAMVHVVWRFHCVWASAAPLATVRSSTSLVVLGGSSIESPWVSFLRRPSEVFLLVLWWPITIRIDVVYMLRVFALVITITRSWSFIWFCNFPLLLNFAEMLDLRFAEFCKLVIELRPYFGPLSH